MIKKVFLVHHTHVDIGYTDIQTKIFEDHAGFIDKVLQYCKKTDKYPEDSKFKWTCEVSWTAKNYFEKRPHHKIRELIKRVKEGRIEITALYLNITELFTQEELIRSIYFAKGLEDRFGVKITSAMNSDVPGFSWSIPQILSKAGIKYFSVSTNDIRANAPSVPRPFRWVSPDGSEVLVWNSNYKSNWYGQGYVLGFGESYNKVKNLLPDYINSLEKEGYPYDAIYLRMGMDNIPPHIEISEISKEWNKRHLFPRVIVSTDSEFFRYMERKYKNQFPVYRLAWPDWWADGNASASYETGLSRITHERLSNVEKFNIFFNYKNIYPKEDIGNAYEKLMFFDEHTWGSSDSIYKPHSLMTKAQWAIKSSFIYESSLKTDELYGNSIKNIVPDTKNNGQQNIVVVNPLSWERTDVVRTRIPVALTGKEQIKIIGGNTYKEVPSQIIDSNDKYVEVIFIANDVPSSGYKTYKIVNSTNIKTDIKPKKPTNLSLENRFYSIKFDSVTGGIKNIYDKELDMELIDQNNSYKLNQYIYEEIISPEGRRAMWDDTVPCIEGKRRNAKFSRTSSNSAELFTANGEIMQTMEAITSAKGCPRISQKIVLYNSLKRIDIINTLVKEEVLVPEAIYYAFPFNITNPKFRLQMSGAVIEPEIEQLPGSCRDWYSVQHWLNISNDKYNITWATKEAPLIQLCGINTGKWLDKLKIKNASFFSWIMNNYWYTNFKASQGGKLTFRYSFTSSAGRFNPLESYRFGLEFCNPLVPVISEGKPFRTTDVSFCKVDKPNIIVSVVKEAEDGKGIIFRLIEIEGKKTKFKVFLDYSEIQKAYLADIADKNLTLLRVSKNCIPLKINGFDTITVRVILKDIADGVQ